MLPLRPRGKITINLAPATVRKEGPSFDLPIALAMLQLHEQNRIPELDHCYICGVISTRPKSWAFTSP
jgi:magnesium chelatase family protein